MKRISTDFLKSRFYPYQRAWLQDDARFKIGLWARQTGKDYTCAAEAVFDCWRREGTHWLIVACGERQAVESLQKARTWAEAIDLEVRYARSAAPISVLKSSATELQFTNGSRITALPANPETVRGYSANVILTEFAFHQDPEAIWRAVFPIVSNPLRGGEKKLRIITTPNGQGNYFHDLWLGSTVFSKHRVTVHDAISAGLPLDLHKLRAGMPDAEAWSQEYECEFIDKSSVLLPGELIASCESAEAFATATPHLLSRCTGPLFVGIDFGRQHDLTACWVLERIEDKLWTRELLVLEKTSTPEQLAILRPRVALARRVCIDYTGAGVGLGDLLAHEFGATPGGKMELCHFTCALKQELFPKLRAAFERGNLRIPRHEAIREDLHSLHRTFTNSGQLAYRASRSADGHSDRATALALALRAADSTPSTVCAVSIGKRFRSAGCRIG